jgi:hypothetical protein
MPIFGYNQRWVLFFDYLIRKGTYLFLKGFLIKISGALHLLSQNPIFFGESF